MFPRVASLHPASMTTASAVLSRHRKSVAFLCFRRHCICLPFCTRTLGKATSVRVVLNPCVVYISPSGNTVLVLVVRSHEAVSRAPSKKLNQEVRVKRSLGCLSSQYADPCRPEEGCGAYWSERLTAFGKQVFLAHCQDIFRTSKNLVALHPKVATACML